MKKTFVIVSVSSRVNDLNCLLQSLEKYLPDFNEWDVSLLFQDNLGNADKINKQHITNFFVEPKLMGCNAARLSLLKRIRYDVYCNLDDDIELTKWTHYEPAIKKILEPDTGFVLTNWARTYEQVEKKSEKMRDVFVKQALIYQGGGMLYNDIIADIVRKLPTKETVFDEGWPLSAYLAGYTNYRYLGSLAVHKICTTGGMREYYKAVDYDALATDFGDYVEYRKAKNGHYHIPLDGDLKPYAKRIHEENRKALGRKLKHGL